MCTYRKEKKKKENSNCGNGIAEIGGDISAMPLPQLLKIFFLFFPISVMALPQLLFFSTQNTGRAGLWAKEFR